MLSVGLTGSIAVGKSYVAGLFRELGCHVLDADLFARAVVAPGTAGLREVARAFGEEIITPAGELDRARLGAIIFADPEKRAQLNSILHPRIIAAQDEALARLAAEDPEGIALVEAALMIESGGYRRFTRLIVVFCRPEVQLERLMRRDQLTREQACQRIAAQMSQDEKKALADYLIDTSAGFSETRRQVEAVFRELKSIGESRSR